MESWLAIYRNFDDDALAALASVGLLRRAAKDLEAGKVAWKEAPGASFALVQADGQIVHIGAEGPASAKCDCPAPGMCKHILAAALWLRQAPVAGTDASAETVTADALAEVLALEPAAVFKLAGAAATRKAAALFADVGQATIAAQGGVLVIELPALELVCRYVAGAGFKGMVSEAPPASRPALHLLALAAVWRSHGKDVAWPGDDERAPAAANVLSESELQFLDRLRQLILEVCRTGWSHVSDIMPAQLRAFAMSARVDSFPRLTGLLRMLAGTAELLARRDVFSDEREAIKIAAHILALCDALAHASGDTLQALRGQARRTFEGNDALELLPLGAHWWEQRSGARGLTISFWDHGSNSIMQTVLARRDANDTGFTRFSAWSTTPLWQGAGAAKNLPDHAVVLAAARRSSDNRLSLSADTRAQMLPPWRATDERWQAAGFEDWQALATAIRRSAGLCGEAISCVLLKPSVLEKPRLDEVHQILSWTLRDRNGLPLVLRLACTPQHLDRIDHIEAWAASGTPIKAVVARVERDMHGGTLEPVSLMIEDAGALRAIALDYVAPKASKAPSFASRIADMFKTKAVAVPWAPAPAHLGHLEAVLDMLENKGMTGRLHVLGEEKTDLLAAQQYLRATGLDVVANAMGHYVAEPNAEKALRVVYLCHACVELDTSFVCR